MIELINLFEDMQRDCPFEDLKTPQIRDNFESAIGAEFEVSVIATMSSGKSTLINSLLGRELMPSKNEACTATIAKIKDIDGMLNYRGEYCDVNKNVIGKYDDLVLEHMNEMNDNPNTAYINIEGDVPNIDSKGIQLVLVDTPGPNNSRTKDHKDHTYKVIKEKTKPMVLYVLNATQLQTNDDEELLSTVSEAMKVGGKQAKDRFLFAVNKIDQFDTDKESVHKALDNVVEYLSKFGIENPNLFPTSAEMAKVIRMNQNGHVLTTRQKKTLRDYDLFVDDEQLHLSNFASLSNNNKKKIQAMLEAAEDEHATAMVHTGIPAVEIAIDEYLEKYAYTIKVKSAIDTFSKKIEEKDMRAKMIKSIQNNEEARKEFNQRLKEVKKQLEKGKSNNIFRNKIKQLDLTKDATKRISGLRSKISSVLANNNGKQQMTTLEAQQLMMKLNKSVSDLQSSVKVELENIIDDVIVKNANDVLNDYKSHMEGLINQSNLNSNSYNRKSDVSFLVDNIPNAQELINEYKYTDRVDSGQKERVKNTEKKWYNPFTWFQPSYYENTIYNDVDMVNYSTVFNDYVQPIIEGFNVNLENAKSTAKNEADKFKSFFLNELNNIEKVIEQKVDEDEKLTSDNALVEKKLAEDKAKMVWLDNFTNRLHAILEI